MKTLEAQLRLYDPVWGGFYRYAEAEDWTEPHYEKMLHIQAQNLRNYLEAYQVTGDQQYRTVAEGIIRYVRRFLTRESGPGFYSSQDAEVSGRATVGGHMMGKEYFALGERRRRKFGTPKVDRAVFTGSNAEMISSYLRAAPILHDESLQTIALNTLDQLVQERYQPGLGVAHEVREGVPSGYGLLGNQISFIRALVDAFHTSGEGMYAHRAEQIAADMIDQLEDPVGGGYFDRRLEPSDRGLLRFPYKPIKDNVRASILMSDLFHLTGNSSYRTQAERALEYVLAAQQPIPSALVGSAVDRLLTHRVQVVVVGDKEEGTTHALVRQALALYAPGATIRVLDPHADSLILGEIQFPAAEVPQAFICSDRFCSQPIQDPGMLPEQLELVLSDISGFPTE